MANKHGFFRPHMGRGFPIAAMGGSRELVTNGTFDADLSGWTDASTAPATVVWSAGQALWQTDGVAGGRIRQQITTESGRRYRIRRDGTANLAVGTSAGGNELLSFSAVADRTFTATSSTTWINIHDVTNGDWADNVSVKKA